MSRAFYFAFSLLLATSLMFTACKYRNNPDEINLTSDSIDVADTTGDIYDEDADTGDDESDSTDETPPSKEQNITVSDPEPGKHIDGSSFTITGEARTFENALSWRLIDSNGVLLADGHTTAKGEMGEFNPFTATVALAGPYNGRATLEVFQYSAKDGSKIDVVALPLTLGAPSQGGGKNSVQLFFTNSRLNRTSDCERVFAVSETSTETVAVAEGALRLLLRGPDDDARKEGYGTEIPSGTKLRSVKIERGTATADFSRDLNKGGGACHVGALRAQIEHTLKQFPTVRRVEITVEGNSAEALQP
jgi:hypothetical protein